MMKSRIAVRIFRAFRCAPLALLLACAAHAADAPGDTQGEIEIAVDISVTGDQKVDAQPTLDGIQLALEEARAAGGLPPIKLQVYDDKSNVNDGKLAAEAIVASRAVIVLGPNYSFLSLAEGPIFAKGGIASLVEGSADQITANPTSFRLLMNNTNLGSLLATYISRALGYNRVAALVIDDGFGRTLRTGFEAQANRLGLDATFYTFKNKEEGEQAARSVAADPAKPAVALLMLGPQGAYIIPALYRGGVKAPMVATGSFASATFPKRLAGEPEEKLAPGTLTANLYPDTVLAVDSTNASQSEFARRFKARFGYEVDDNVIEAYDAATLAFAGARAIDRSGATEISGKRAAALTYFDSIDAPEKASPGLVSPIWFEAHGRVLDSRRFVRFARNLLESAPVQIAGVSAPDPAELASGQVFETSPGAFGRLQSVTYTGIYVNQITGVDIAQRSFGADFYVWMRYTPPKPGDTTDPSDILFPGMISGAFDRTRPSEQGELPDGTVYKLWRVRGTFRAEYDLHRYPFDQQRLGLTLFNSRAAFERLVYVADRRALPDLAAGGGMPTAGSSNSNARIDGSPIVAASAFNDLTQWEPVDEYELRDNLLTQSALGDPRRVGAQSYRELSGFRVNLGIQRKVLATLIKSLLPLIILTVMMFISLLFPHPLVAQKITVAITAALSGAVLLTAINSQLGGVGYTVAVDYAFYVFFGLSTLCIVSVLITERLRLAGHKSWATRAEHLTRLAFLCSVAAIGIGAATIWP